MTPPIVIQDFQALSPSIIAGCAAAIAFFIYQIAHQQAVTARQMFRLDLLHRRFAIYQSVLDALVEAINSPGEAVLIKETFVLRRKLNEARFFFPAETFNHLDALETPLLQYRSLRSSFRAAQSSGSSMEQSLIDTMNAHHMWLLSNLKQLDVELGLSLKVEEQATSSLSPWIEPAIKAQRRSHSESFRLFASSVR